MKAAGRRKTKAQSHTIDYAAHPTKSTRTNKKTEFNSFLKTKNNRKVNAFAMCNSNDALDTKDLFTRPKIGAGAVTVTSAQSSVISFGSNRGSNSSASICKVRLNNNDSSKTNKLIQSETRSHSKDTNHSLASVASLNNNSNSIRNNNTSSNASNNKSGAPRRVVLVSLPLDPNKNRYDSSSDDEIPYLTTPSTSHQSDKKFSLDFASLVAGVDLKTGHKIEHHGHGVRSIPDPLGMSSNYPMLSSLSPHTPPYNKNQSMGKNNHIHHKNKQNQKKNIYIYRKFVKKAKKNCTNSNAPPN